MKNVIILYILFSIMCPFADLIAAPARLNKEQKKESTIKRLEHYLNLLPTIKATFIQENANGEMIDGTLYIDRQNKRLRLEYPTLHQHIVARNGFVYVADVQDKSIQSVDASYTPVGLLLQSNIIFGQTVFVKNLKETSKEAFIILSDSNDENAPAMMLNFSLEPFILLKGWTVTDIQGNMTNIKITDIKGGLTFDDKLFDKPSFDK